MVSGTVLAMSTAAVAHTDKPPQKGDCVVQHVDDRGEVVRTTTEPEGREHGQFRCVAGRWTFAWAPFGADDLITADEIQIDPSGAVSARRFAAPRSATPSRWARSPASPEPSAAVARCWSTARSWRSTTARSGLRSRSRRCWPARTPPGYGCWTSSRSRMRPCRRRTSSTRPAAPRDDSRLLQHLGRDQGLFAWIVDTIGDIGEWIDDHCAVGTRTTWVTWSRASGSPAEPADTDHRDSEMRTA
ncbi:hypothetical protein NKG94_45460 [Micromonospora sp. M12]